MFASLGYLELFVFVCLDNTNSNEFLDEFSSFELVAAEAFETDDLVLQFSVDEHTDCWEGSYVQFVHEKWCFFSIYVEKLRLWVDIADGSQMFVHNLASFELLMVEVHDRPVELRNVVQKLCFCNLQSI